MANMSSIRPIDSLSPAVAKELGMLGKTSAFSCLADPQFTYYLYAPTNYYTLTTVDKLNLLVIVHGSARDPYRLREEFATFAQQHACFLLCPLFPIGFLDPADTDNYKRIRYRDVRYDHVVLSMVDDVRARYPRLAVETFGLYGFSGGGQFVHRFAYLHPRRLSALVCGAPGSITWWDTRKAFPAGVGNLHEVFGGGDGVDDERQWESALRMVPTLFVCGTADTSMEWTKLRGRTIEDGMEGGRLSATMRLADGWRSAGADAKFVGVEGAKHEESKMIPVAMAFLKETLLKDTVLQAENGLAVVKADSESVVADISTWSRV